MSQLETSPIHIEDRVRVYNPDPLDVGSVLDIQGKRALIEWESDGSRSWSLLKLLRVED